MARGGHHGVQLLLGGVLGGGLEGLAEGRHVKRVDDEAVVVAVVVAVAGRGLSPVSNGSMLNKS
jgi:hypothetical protein